MGHTRVVFIAPAALSFRVPSMSQHGSQRGSQQWSQLGLQLVFRHGFRYVVQHGLQHKSNIGDMVHSKLLRLASMDAAVHSAIHSDYP